MLHENLLINIISPSYLLSPYQSPNPPIGCLHTPTPLSIFPSISLLQFLNMLYLIRVAYAISPLIFPLNPPFKITMTCDGYFFSLFSYQNVSITLPLIRTILHIPLSPRLPPNMISSFYEFYLTFLLYVPSHQDSLHRITCYSKILFIYHSHPPLISSYELSKPHPPSRTRGLHELFTVSLQKWCSPLPTFHIGPRSWEFSRDVPL